ncbi:hypothetical protein [Rhodoligotrophos defluvii]|uniref:hypothetical protein n=1 Tax=Rhodoligotrophos defluvii TaxID=2561934 RepID=UPI0014851BEA|nr:hypothetical protein [Rhodoligotrophos defluvii]
MEKDSIIARLRELIQYSPTGEEAEQVASLLDASRPIDVEDPVLAAPAVIYAPDLPSPE